ncbi:MAG TPA: fatty acid desaturase [Acidimicrobiales bacterium]|nr:fatty acid desaturase [Acidimicrobiales bacterium]
MSATPLLGPPLERPAQAPVSSPPSRAAEPAAVATVRGRTSALSRGITVVAVVVPPVGLGLAISQLWGRGVVAVDVALLIGLYLASAVGVTVGFHRYFTHRGFVTRRWVEAVLAVLGSITLQGPLTQWVTDHRKHHALSDRPGDPHSPHAYGAGLVPAVRGLWHAHVGWMFRTKGMERGDAYGRDLFDDPMIRTIDRLYMVWVVLSLGLPFAVGFAVRGTLGGAAEALVWGGLLRIFLFHHATFSVNSICHMFGSRPYAARDESRNNWLVAALTFGEGWHNNHHAFPRSARHGLGRLQVDPAWWVVRALQLTGLAWDVKVADPSRRRAA